jgi:hypothetical protein
MWEEKVIDMGGKLAKRWSTKITHLVFQDGRSSYLKKGMMQNCFIVTPLWIQEMEMEGKYVSEENFSCADKYNDLLSTPNRLKDYAKNEDLSTPERIRRKNILSLRRNTPQKMVPLNGLSTTPISTPKKLLFQTPPCTPKMEKSQNKLLAPNTQHRTQRRKVTDSPTIIPDTPDRNSDAENDWGDISVHRIPATQ